MHPEAVRQIHTQLKNYGAPSYVLDAVDRWKRSLGSGLPSEGVKTEDNVVMAMVSAKKE